MESKSTLFGPVAGASGVAAVVAHATIMDAPGAATFGAIDNNTYYAAAAGTYEQAAVAADDVISDVTRASSDEAARECARKQA